MLVIGDVHGKLDAYFKLLNSRRYRKMPSIQVGDFGFKEEHEWHMNNYDPERHKINFGNHDDQTFLNAPHSLGNFSCLDKGIMTVRGAYSVDVYKRKEGIDWWANEEMNYGELQEAIDAYIAFRPRIMITHDCPQSICHTMFGITDKSITKNGLEAMFNEHQPDLWIFGHHHRSQTALVNGTKFICLAELETIVID